MMHCVLNGINLGIRSLFFGIRSMFFGVTDLTLIWDTVPVLWDTVHVRLAYAYIYYGEFVCIVFMIYIFLVA
jgi:hypothetical protein